MNMERNYKIIIIDDEKGILSTYKEYFDKRGFIVDTACDGSEGFEKLSEGEFDVAIIDIKMPKMDGIELTGKIREKGIDTSLIILTGHGGEEEAINAVNLGVDAWFGKAEIEMNKLLDKVKELSEGVPLDEIRRLLSVIPDED